LFFQSGKICSFGLQRFSYPLRPRLPLFFGVWRLQSVAAVSGKRRRLLVQVAVVVGKVGTGTMFGYLVDQLYRRLLSCRSFRLALGN
jgi:hypothetical protein